jgi:three-Cys-motif partner protein
VLFKGTTLELGGSPIIALNSKPGFTDYVLCEKDKRLRDALDIRADPFTAHRNVTVLPAQDFNQVAPSIVSRIPDDWHIFAFLDPFGLELGWRTVEALAAKPHRELIINLSSGLFRCANSEHTQDAVDFFMGMHDDWLRYRSEELLALYRNNVAALGFKYVKEYPVKGKKSPIYYLILATNSPTADKIVKQRMTEVNLTALKHLQMRVEKEAGRLSTLDDFISTTPQTRLDTFVTTKTN